MPILVPVPKHYWSIFKTFANSRKVPVIPPLLINNEFISNFKTKANYSLTDSLNNNVQQFPQMTPYLTLSILQQMKL